MRCPYCKHGSDKVVDSRSSGESIRRRRECMECKRRFTTYEYIEIVPLTVIKRDESREEFQRDKLLRGIYTACKKRPISPTQIDEIALRIENQLATRDNSEVTYEEIGTLVMKELYDLDSVAYVRFASVYREFKDTTEFVEQIKTLLETNPKANPSSKIKN